jgi:hypothetical protein
MELFVTLLLAVLSSIAFGLFVSAIVPNTDIVLYAILVQLFVQIILGGTLFPIDNKAVSSATISYWTTDAMGSTIDIPQLNRESYSCQALEIDNPLTGAKEREYNCSLADTDLSLDYEHTANHVIGTWWGLIIHLFLWLGLTIFVQARKKAE